MRSTPNPAPELEAPFLSAPARWERTMFLSPTPDYSCPPVIDATGEARILVYGPYVQLCEGLWRTVVSFELCEEAARRKFAVEFGAGPHFTTVDVPLGVPGRHDIEVTHSMGDDERAEIRIWVKAAAFHGELRFLGASVEPVAQVRALSQV